MRLVLRWSCAAFAGLSLSILLTACASQSASPESQSIGPQPLLPKPDPMLIPTVEIAKAVGWKNAEAPIPAAGLRVQAFARGLQHPRWLLVLPNGDVLVAESNAPPDSGAIKGIKGKVMGWLMRNAGAGVESPNRVTLLRDADGDGVAEQSETFVEGVQSPFGMALVEQTLYVASAEAVLAFDYRPGQLRAEAPGRLIAELPHGPGPLNHHWTKSLLASADGRHLYVGVGSNSNAAEGGMDKESDRAAILRIDIESGQRTVVATGLRNPVGLAWQPESGKLWAVVNERDALGDQLVPDYLTEIVDGAFYGWPYSYYGANLDPRVKPQRPELVATARVPDYALGAHVAPLGLVFYAGTALPDRLHGAALIAEHGSWNRADLVGYKVVALRFENGQPVGMPEDLLTGFLSSEGKANGRPVGLAVDGAGGVLVADDVGNTIWRVSAASP